MWEPFEWRWVLSELKYPEGTYRFVCGCRSLATTTVVGTQLLFAVVAMALPDVRIVWCTWNICCNRVYLRDLSFSTDGLSLPKIRHWVLANTPPKTSTKFLDGVETVYGWTPVTNESLRAWRIYVFSVLILFQLIFHITLWRGFLRVFLAVRTTPRGA